MKEPLVYISVLNWSNYPDTIACIESLGVLDYSNYKIIIRDNASPNDSVEKLKVALPHFTICTTEENEGYATGHFLNWQIAKDEGAELFWILNNDLKVDRNTLKELVKVAEKTQFRHLYGSVSLQWENHDLVDFGGAELSPISNKILTYNSWRNKKYTELVDAYPDYYEVESLEGSSMLIPMHIIEKYGFMKLDCFMYGEETDYCYRLRKLGVSSLLAIKSIVFHKNEGSTKHSALMVVPAYYRRRNALRFNRDHLGWSGRKVLNYNGTVFETIKILVKNLYRSEKTPEYVYSLAKWHGFIGKFGKTIAPEKTNETNETTSC